MTTSPLISGREAQRLLGITPTEWRRLLQAGVIKPVYQIPGAYPKYRRNDLTKITGEKK